MKQQALKSLAIIFVATLVAVTGSTIGSTKGPDAGVHDQSAESRFRDSDSPARSINFTYYGELRLNNDGLSDLVFLSRGSIEPALVFTSPAATFTVNSTGDGADSNTSDGVCDDGTGNCTLRAAIQQANASAGADMITFSLGAGTPTINVGATTGLGLPAITGTVTIDGNTGGATRVELNGAGVTTASNGLNINATGCAVRNLVINRFNGDGINITQGSGLTRKVKPPVS